MNDNVESVRSNLLAKLDPLTWYVIAFFSIIYFFIGEYSYIVFKLSLIPLVAISMIYKYWVRPMHGAYNNNDVSGFRLVFYKLICFFYYLLFCWIVSFFVYFPLFHFFGVSANSL